MRHNCPFAKEPREKMAAQSAHGAEPPRTLPLMWGATECHRCLSADACLGYLHHGSDAASMRTGSRGLGSPASGSLASPAMDSSTLSAPGSLRSPALGSPTFPQGLRRSHFRTR